VRRVGRRSHSPEGPTARSSDAVGRGRRCVVDYTSEPPRRRRGVKGRATPEREPECQQRLAATLDSGGGVEPSGTRSSLRTRSRTYPSSRGRRGRFLINRPRIHAAGSSPWKRRASPALMRRRTLAGRNGTAVDGLRDGGRSPVPPHLGSSRSLRTCSLPIKALMYSIVAMSLRPLG
jgi:hypothetical protein